MKAFAVFPSSREVRLIDRPEPVIAGPTGSSAAGLPASQDLWGRRRAGPGARASYGPFGHRVKVPWGNLKSISCRPVDLFAGAAPGS
jgi:hypothetical protein